MNYKENKETIGMEQIDQLNDLNESLSRINWEA